MTPARCFDVGGTKIVAADVLPNGDINELNRTSTPVHSYNEFINTLLEHSPSDASDIGISIAGVINPGTGVVKSANIPCISGKALQADLTQALKRNVFVINDANAFTLAEANFGVAQEHEVVLGIILGTGIGGGIVINKRVLQGFNGTAGEWGHGPFSTTRTKAALPTAECDCGQKNCLDMVGGAVGLQRLHTHFHNETRAAEKIVIDWQRGEAAAMRTVDVWLDIVGGALANIVNFIDPAIVVVGGGMANATELIKALDAEVGNRRLARHTAPLLNFSTHSPEQGLLGAAMNMLTEQGV